MKKAIVVYRSFHDIPREVLFPEVHMCKSDETPEEALKRIWSEHYDSALAVHEEQLDETDLLCLEFCYCHDDMALITWEDGDTVEFYICDVEEE